MASRPSGSPRVMPPTSAKSRSAWARFGSTLKGMGLLTRELDPDPALRGVVRRATYFEERSAGPMRRVEGPMLGVVLLFSLGPDIEVAGERIGSFAAGLWDRPVTTGHFGEQRGYQLYLDVLGARRLLGVPMSELSNRLVPLEDLLGRQADELTERLAEPGMSTGVTRWRRRRSRVARWTAIRPRLRSPMRSIACAQVGAPCASRRSRPRSAGALGTSRLAFTRTSAWRPRWSPGSRASSTRSPCCAPVGHSPTLPTRAATPISPTSIASSALWSAARRANSDLCKTPRCRRESLMP